MTRSAQGKYSGPHEEIGLNSNCWVWCHHCARVMALHCLLGKTKTTSIFYQCNARHHGERNSLGCAWAAKPRPPPALLSHWGTELCSAAAPVDAKQDAVNAAGLTSQFKAAPTVQSGADQHKVR